MHEAHEKNFYIINFQDGTADVIETSASPEEFNRYYDVDVFNQATSEDEEGFNTITEYLVWVLREEGYFADQIPNLYQYQWFD